MLVGDVGRNIQLPAGRAWLLLHLEFGQELEIHTLYKRTSFSAPGDLDHSLSMALVQKTGECQCQSSL